MPANAAGPWQPFDAEDKATWPVENGLYLALKESSGYGLFEWEDGAWHWGNGEDADDVTHYAEIVPPSPGAEKEP